MKKYLFLLLAFTCCPWVKIGAQNPSDTQIMQKISQAAASLQTMQCDFIQTKHLKMLNDDMISQGKMYYQQPDKLRWEYTTPYTYIFILNKDKVFLKNAKRNDVIDVNQNKVFREIARIMMSSVVGNCLSDDKSFKTTIATTSTEWIATLFPSRKEIKQLFQKIILYFSKQKLYVTKLILMEKNGDVTTIELKNIHINEAISQNIFSNK